VIRCISRACIDTHIRKFVKKRPTFLAMQAYGTHLRFHGSHCHMCKSVTCKAHLTMTNDENNPQRTDLFIQRLTDEVVPSVMYVM